MAQMGQDSLKTNLTNPARSYLWDVLIPVPIGDGDTTTYQIRAQSTQIPGRSSGEITIPYKQTAGVVVAGKMQYDHKWTCTFLEGEDKKVFDAIHSWQQLITDDVTGIGVGDPLYKTDIYITLIKVAGDTFQKIKLKGCWVQNVGTVDLSYGNEDTIKYSVTFEYDSWLDVT